MGLTMWQDRMSLLCLSDVRLQERCWSFVANKELCSLKHFSVFAKSNFSLCCPTKTKPIKRTSLKNFLHSPPSPPLLLINIVFENFVYSVTICFNGENFFRLPPPTTTLENIRAFVHSFRRNVLYVMIMQSAQFRIWASAKKRQTKAGFNWL